MSVVRGRCAATFFVLLSASGSECGGQAGKGLPLQMGGRSEGELN